MKYRMSLEMSKKRFVSDSIGLLSGVSWRQRTSQVGLIKNLKKNLSSLKVVVWAMTTIKLQKKIRTIIIHTELVH